MDKEVEAQRPEVIGLSVNLWQRRKPGCAGAPASVLSAVPGFSDRLTPSRLLFFKVYIYYIHASEHVCAVKWLD